MEDTHSIFEFFLVDRIDFITDSGLSLIFLNNLINAKAALCVPRFFELSVLLKFVTKSCS